MKISAIIVAFFISAAIASPTPVDGAKNQLEKRGCSTAGCACISSQCWCDLCNDGGCTWYMQSPTC